MNDIVYNKSLHNAIRYWNYSSAEEDELPWADWILREAGLLATVCNDEQLGYEYSIVDPQLYTMFNLRYSESRISTETIRTTYSVSFG